MRSVYCIGGAACRAQVYSDSLRHFSILIGEPPPLDHAESSGCPSRVTTSTGCPVQALLGWETIQPNDKIPGQRREFR